MTKFFNPRPLNYFEWFLLLANWGLILLILMGFMARWMSPIQQWAFAFAALPLHYFWFINVLLMFYWLIRRVPFVIFSLIINLLGLFYVNKVYRFEDNEIRVDQPKTIKVITFNVHIFDQYQKLLDGKYEARNKIFDFLKAENADVVCLQEFFNQEIRKGVSTQDSLQKLLKMPYVFSVKYKGISKKYRMVILSKQPFMKEGVVLPDTIGDENFAIWVDMMLLNQKVRLYNIHLKSFRISNENLEYDVSTDEGKSSLKEGGRRFASKFKHAFIGRAKQVALLKDDMDQLEDQSIILCGDFNDTPTSWAYYQIQSDLNDAFIEKGQGFGTTYNGPYPAFRIDYVLYSEAFKAYQFNLHKEKMSDHYPISVLLGLNEIEK